MSNPRHMFRRRWSGLTLQLFLLILLPLTLLLLLVAVGGSLLHQRAMRDLVGERDQRAARAAAAAIDEQLQQRATAIHGLAQAAAASDDPTGALQTLAPLLPDFPGGVALFTADGVLLAASGDPPSLSALPSPGARTGQVAYYFLPPSSKVTSAQDLVVVANSATAQTASDRLLAPGIVTAPGSIIAIGAFSATDTTRSALARAFGGASAGSAFVATASGDLIYRAGPPPAATTSLLEHPGVISALRGESGATYFTTDQGEIVVAFSPITPLGWALVFEEPWHAVADPLLQTTEWAPLILVPLLLITVLALAFGARQVVRPLQSLEEKATALAWGDFAAIEEPVGGIAEIQHLQNELVHMAHKVRDAQQSLRGYLGAVTVGQEEERRRLARELHDDAIQSLIALNQRLQLAQLNAATGADAAAGAQPLEEMQQMVTALIAGLRRQIHALRPIYLEDLGLLPALQMLAQEVQTNHDLPVAFHSEGPERRLPAPVELALYRIAQEALNNVARHANATTASLTLTFDDDGAALTVRDDGAGFHVPQSPAQLAPQGHFGLLGIHERAELIGAHLTIQSQPNAGTRLHIQVPTQSPIPNLQSPIS